MFESEPPARRAALLSREYVQAGNKAGWLGLFAEHAVIEDPIGVSPFDPSGEGHRGAQAREAFWDRFIAPCTIEIDVVDSFAAGREVANLVEITTVIPTGERRALQQKVFGVVTYRVDQAGMLLALRAYWDIDDPRNALSEIELEQGGGADR